MLWQGQPERSVQGLGCRNIGLALGILAVCDRLVAQMRDAYLVAGRLFVAPACCMLHAEK